MQRDRMALKIETRELAMMVRALMDDPHVTSESLIGNYLIFNYTLSIPYTVLSEKGMRELFEYVIPEAMTTIQFVRLTNAD